jgi:hypothetical protein
MPLSAEARAARLNFRVWSIGALAKGDPDAPDGGHWQRMALSWPEVVIGGGTPNIQRNIIAERVLGLPKD